MERKTGVKQENDQSSNTFATIFFFKAVILHFMIKEKNYVSTGKN